VSQAARVRFSGAPRYPLRHRRREITDWVRAQIPPYAIRNFNGLCTGAGARVTTVVCAPDAAGQRWSLPGDGTVRTADGLCLAVSGTAVGTAACAAVPEQQWRFPGDGTLRTAAGACADIGSNAAGTSLLVTSCAAGNLTRASSGGSIAEPRSPRPGGSSGRRHR
jgi:hypothetical protein